LMAMCVENGMFTVSFLKEGISKVCPLSSLHRRPLMISSEDGLMTYYDPHGRVVRTPIYLSRVQVQWEEFTLPKHSVYPITGLSPYVY
jgi:hypothetical protein